MALTPGQTLQHRYRITGTLGQGGMGAVYRAWDTRLGIAVAIKAMTLGGGLDPAWVRQAREQFHQEAIVLSQLSHPHLVRVSDFFDEGGSTYLVMTFVAGESLADYIVRVGRVPEDLVLSWADQLLDALAYCHGKGVIHRDIKPQNIILSDEGNLVLVDFGLVKVWNPDDPTTRTVIRSMGTPQYAPPEQYAPEIGHTDQRSDLYSLGATLYHALTGQSPPSATTRIVNPANLVPIRELAPLVSVAVAQAIERAMALQPDARFANAAQMRSALRQSPGKPSKIARTAVLPGSETTTTRWEPRWKYAAAALVALLLFGLIGATVVAGYQWLSERRDPALPLPSPTATGTVATSTPTATPSTEIVNVAEATSSSTPLPDTTPTQETTPTPEPPSTSTPRPSDTPSPTSRPALIVVSAGQFADEAALRAVHNVNAPGGATDCILRLTPPPRQLADGPVIAFSYTIRQTSPNDYCGFERWRSDPQNWTGFSRLCVDLLVDGSADQVVVQFREAGGEVWRNRTPAGSVPDGGICLPLSKTGFERAEWGTLQNDRIDLGAIDYYGIYVNGQPGARGVIYLDRIRAVAP